MKPRGAAYLRRETPVTWILRALLDLLSRNACLQEPILPALVDGGVSGAALRDDILSECLFNPTQLRRSLTNKDIHPHQFQQYSCWRHGTDKWQELSAERCFLHHRDSPSSLGVPS